jgi:hypothetical protein
MENNVKGTMAMRISTQPSTIRIVIDKKQPGNMECCNYLGVLITRTGEINSRMITSGIKQEEFSVY